MEGCRLRTKTKTEPKTIPVSQRKKEWQKTHPLEELGVKEQKAKMLV